MNQRVDLKETMSRVLKKGWLILLLIAALAAAARFVSANYIQKIYKASATMFIGTEQQGTVSNLTLSEIEASNRLIVDYKEIANSRRVIDPVTEELDLEMDLLDFRKALELEIIANSRLFTVSFSSPDPELAADVANSVSQQLLTSISDIVNVQNVRVIDSAQVPTLPDSPDVNMITILAAVLGLIVGLLVVYFNSVFNDTYSSQEAIENELQLDVVAVIPRFREEKSSYSKGLAAITEPNSMLSESFKMLRTNISYMNKEGLNKVIMLTSSVASEGKTTTSCNLAVTIAQDHKKVLLIDGDLRKPNLFKMFKIMMMPGLTDIIYGKYTLPEAIQRSVDVPGLDILTAGRLTSITTELLGSVSFRRIIDEARERYDYIIIDAPPIINVPDTIIISQLVDKVLFIVAMDETHRALVREAKKGLDKVSVKMMGMVLTNMKINPRSYYYGAAEGKKRLR